MNLRCFRSLGCAANSPCAMNSMPHPFLSGDLQLRNPRNLISNSKVRVAVFGSFMGGCHVLRELLFGSLAGRVSVVGVATDDPSQPFTHPTVRLWKYPHTRNDELMVPTFATEHEIPVFTGRINSPEFHELFFDEWKPALCLMATFGQKIPRSLFDHPRLVFYNFHHSGPTWPSYPGPDPIAAMVRDGRTHLVLTVHRVSDEIDGGEFVARSHSVAIPAGVNAIDMHRITWPQMGAFIRRTVELVMRDDVPSGQAIQELALLGCGA